MTSALASPATGFRRWLDPHLAAGTWAVRQDWRAHLPDAVPVPAPLDLGHEAGAVGRAVDARLRLAFTTSDAVADATYLGIADCATMSSIGIGTTRSVWWQAIAHSGADLAQEICRTADTLQLADRRRRFARQPATEARLARMLLVAAWFEVMFRAGTVGFEGTPIALRATGSGDYTELLDLVPQPLVDDVVNLVNAAARSPLAALRATTAPGRCVAGPTFEGSTAIHGADADLLVDETLIEFKCTKGPSTIPLTTIWQILGYPLLDYSDEHAISHVALYHCRAATLVRWPIDQYLRLLACDTDLPMLRAEARRLCDATDSYYRPQTTEQRDQLNRVLELLDVPPPGACRRCHRPRAEPSANPYVRWYCSEDCREYTRQVAESALRLDTPVSVSTQL